MFASIDRWNEQIKFKELLFSLGADINAEIKIGGMTTSVFEQAIRRSNLKIVLFFIAAGADLGKIYLNKLRFGDINPDTLLYLIERGVPYERDLVEFVIRYSEEDAARSRIFSDELRKLKELLAK
jgi:hypothetical protein